MNEMTKLLVSLSLSGSMLAVFLLLLKPIMRRRLSKSVQYYIWIAVLLRMVLPFSVEDSVMHHVLGGTQAPAAASDDAGSLAMPGANEASSSVTPSPADQAAGRSAAGEAASSEGGSLAKLFNRYALAVWLSGAIAMLAVNALGYIRFARWMQATSVQATERETALLESLSGGRNRVRLARNAYVTTPMLVGLLKPVIIIPDIDFGETRLKHILLHEVTHLKRFDIAVKWFVLLVLSVHWFNPLMYWMRKEIIRVSELSCDEAVIRKLRPSEKQDYGETLIAMAGNHRGRAGMLQATFGDEKAMLKERLAAILRPVKQTKAAVTLSVLLVAAVVIMAVALGTSAGKGATPKQANGHAIGRADLERLKKNAITREEYERMSGIIIDVNAGKLPVSALKDAKPLLDRNPNYVRKSTLEQFEALLKGDQ